MSTSKKIMSGDMIERLTPAKRKRLQAKRETQGWLGTAPPNLRADKLKLHLPERLRAMPEAAPFLSDVERIIAQVSTRPRRPSAGERRAALTSIEAAVHQLQNVLSGLDFASETYEDLEPDFQYKLKRSREGRPVGPALPDGTPDLPDLLERLKGDLSALRLGCASAAAGIPVDRNSRDKGPERLLAYQVAHAYSIRFGKLPPKRSWFADDFLAYIGGEIGLDIGHGIVGEIVAAMT